MARSPSIMVEMRKRKTIGANMTWSGCAVQSAHNNGQNRLKRKPSVGYIFKHLTQPTGAMSVSCMTSHAGLSEKSNACTQNQTDRLGLGFIPTLFSPSPPYSSLAAAMNHAPCRYIPTTLPAVSRGLCRKAASEAAKKEVEAME